jgi:TPR repeat protein
MATLLCTLVVAPLLAAGFGFLLTLCSTRITKRLAALQTSKRPRKPKAVSVVVALAFIITPWLAEAYGQAVDHEYGVGWHEKAAETGAAEAQYRLGRFYETGFETAPDPAAARLWYGRAAEQGHPQAQLRLALLLQEGLGGPADLSGAARWYDAAAVQGLPEAQYNLAVLLERGRGIEADPGAAVRLYESAAQAGIAAAAGQLAVMLINGRGVAEDKVAALAWLIVAADKSVPGAAALRDTLSAELGAAARREAEARAAALGTR